MSDSGGVAAGLRRGGGVFPEAVSRKVRWGDEMKKPPSSGGFEFWAKWLRARSRAAGWRIMANHKSSKKRIRQTLTKRAHNRLYHKTARNAVKALRNTTEKIIFYFFSC